MHPLFRKAFNFTIAHEGGFSCHKNDPGGITRYGISAKSYPNEDIKNLTLNRAMEIYYRDFWIAEIFEKISSEKVVIKYFDLSVNMGIRQATICVQRALRANGFVDINDDGICGHKTIAAILCTNHEAFLYCIRSEAAGYYRILCATNYKLKSFLNGWLNRAYS